MISNEHAVLPACLPLSLHSFIWLLSGDTPRPVGRATVASALVFPNGTVHVRDRGTGLGVAGVAASREVPPRPPYATVVVSALAGGLPAADAATDAGRLAGENAADSRPHGRLANEVAPKASETEANTGEAQA